MILHEFTNKSEEITRINIIPHETYNIEMLF